MTVKKLSSDEIRTHKGISFPGVTTSFICHDGKGNIFLAKRSNKTRDEHGRWDVGAGGLKHGYSLIDNVRRELKEEYDVTPISADFLGYIDCFRKSLEGQDTHWLDMVFVVRVNPAEVRINEPDMVDDSGWFTLDKMPQPMHSMWPLFEKELGTKLRTALGVTQTS